MVGVVLGAIVLVCALCGIGAGFALSGAGSKSSDGAKSTPAPPSDAAPTSNSRPGTVKLVSVVGKRLPDAVQQLESTGLKKITPVDATSQKRAIINPTNWIVRAQSPVAGSQISVDTEVTLKVGKPSDTQPSPRVVSGAVPNVVCRDLQSAQDTLQAAGFYNLGSEDGTGQGRLQIIDRNWIVIRQSAPAGSRPASTQRIVLTVVKYGEPTGSSGCKS